MQKPFSQACENNKRAILDVLRRHVDDVQYVLEVGSGTGQHAAFLAAQLPHLIWQPSDLSENLFGIEQWIEEAQLTNLRPVIELDVRLQPWPIDRSDAVFSANTAHIMSWSTFGEFVAGAGDVLSPGGLFVLYGPFNYDGRYTSESNARFDEWLHQHDSQSGIRDVEKVDALAASAALHLIEDNPMPANNRLRVWCKRQAPLHATR